MPKLPDGIVFSNGEINIDAVREKFPVLKERHLVVTDLFFNEAKSIHEIMVLLGRSNSTVKSDLSYAVFILGQGSEP